MTLTFDEKRCLLKWKWYDGNSSVRKYKLDL